MTKRRAIFLDRDGVINVNRRDHVKTVDEFVFLPNALGALRQISELDFVVVVTTNQAVINRKLVGESTVREINAHMRVQVSSHGGRIDAVYYCPHTPEENCGCRKPKPGMYLQAAHEWDLDPALSYVIGDARSDMEAARAIGARAILVLSGRGCDRQANGNGHACEECGTDCIIADNLLDAVEWISATEKARP